MHGEGRDTFRNAGAQGDDARYIRRICRLGHAAEDDLIHQRRIQPSAGQQGVHSDATKFIRTEFGEVRASFAERRADAVHDGE